MKLTRRSKSTPQDFLNQLNSKITELEGQDNAVQSSTEIEEDNCPYACYDSTCVFSADDIAHELRDIMSGENLDEGNAKSYMISRLKFPPRMVMSAESAKDLDEDDEGYLYLTSVGYGPGLLPPDVKVLRTKALNDYLSAVWLSRWLSGKEIEKAGFYSETKIQDVLDRYGLTMEDVESDDEIKDDFLEEDSMSQDDEIKTTGAIDDVYYQELVDSVNLELGDIVGPDETINWAEDFDALKLDITDKETGQIHSFNIPYEDLQGDVNTDTTYILDAVKNL